MQTEKDNKLNLARELLRALINARSNALTLAVIFAVVAILCAVQGTFVGLLVALLDGFAACLNFSEFRHAHAVLKQLEAKANEVN